MQFHLNCGLRQSGSWNAGESAHYMRNSFYHFTPDPSGLLKRFGNNTVVIVSADSNKAYAAFKSGMSLADRFKNNLLVSYRVRFPCGTEVSVLESELRENKDFLRKRPETTYSGS
ncbi:hypothetical protein [Hydrocarboniphaga effusa]|uniref:Uncharacterized protein n=1 Tax=Hydrocarboniphaga effusa AP103 TaxID=1172194 RepID=I8TEB2_9GAMM|nr:hypothetical protein [Hydrocarboniphaga effusa]EIT72013.1 hypothetical protein WQQ_21500 [Hydrocarboniphaga effusa AP103]